MQRKSQATKMDLPIGNLKELTSQNLTILIHKLK
jgi:hypothetical protein